MLLNCSSPFRACAPTYLPQQITSFQPSITFLCSCIMISDGCKLTALISYLPVFSTLPSFLCFPTSTYPGHICLESPFSSVIHTKIASVQTPLLFIFVLHLLESLLAQSIALCFSLSISHSTPPSIHQLTLPPPSLLHSLPFPV